MNQRKIPRPGEIYKHFKNNLYQIITVATHTETGEKMVVYQALYGTFKTYVRPLTMFMEEVDKVKYPQAEQKFRFELVDTTEEDEDIFLIEDIPNNSPVDVFLKKEDETKKETESEREKEIGITEYVVNGGNTAIQEESVNPVLLEFLDAPSYEEKLYILLNNKKHITDKMINDMALAIDCTVGEGDIEDRIAEFAFCLQTHARFENKRLR